MREHPAEIVAAAREGRRSVREAGEALRAEAERRTRALDPAVVDDLLALEATVRRVRGLVPWWRWATGTALTLAGNPHDALPHLERAWQGFRRSGARLEAARVSLLLVDSLASAGRHRTAVTRGRWALDVFRHAGDRVHEASMLVNLGGVEESLDRIRTAMELWRQAQRLVPDDDALLRGILAANLAAGSSELGRLADAERLYREAARLLEEAGAVGSALQPRLGLAELEALRGRLADALADAGEVLAGAARTGDRNLELEASVLLASTFRRHGRLREAVEVAGRAEPLALEAGRLRDAARLAAERALALVEDGTTDAAGPVHHALERMDAAGTSLLRQRFLVDLAAAGWRLEPRALAGAAEALERHGLRVAAAEAQLLTARFLPRDEAMEVCRRVLARRAIPRWIRMEAHRLAGVLASTDDPERAHAHFLRAAAIAKEVRGRLPTTTDREAFSRRLVPLAEDAVRILASREEPRWGRRARRILARLASAELLEEIAQQVEAGENGGRARRWRELRGELRALLELGERSSQGGVRSIGSAGSLSRELAGRIGALERELARSFPVLPGKSTGRRVDGARFLHAGEAAVEIVPAGPDIFLFLHAPGRFRHLRIREGREAAIRLMERIGYRMRRLDHGRRWIEAAGRGLTTEVERLLEAAGRLLLDPASRWIRDAAHVFLVPHGELFDLPWPALRLDGAPLIEGVTVSLLPSLDILAARATLTPRKGRRLGVAGAPTEDLPEIGPEVRELAAAVPGARIVERATVADAMKLLASCDAVHFSAHGVFRHDWGMASGIRLTDGWLTAAALMGCPLRARLVTAGACELGQGGGGPALELRGFLRALFGVGVGCAMLPAGPLDDGVARATAVAFHRRLAHSGPARAFREALLEVRDHFPSPVLWSGWRLFGDPETWEA